MAEPSVLEQVKQSIERMQQFDTAKLSRREELGMLNFESAVAPAEKLVNLYKRLAISALADFPEDILNNLKNVADADYSRFSQILDFSPAISNPVDVRDQYVNYLKDAYNNTFRSIWQYIAYGVSKVTDTQRLETEARGVLQGIKDQVDQTAKQIEQSAKEAEQSLIGIRLASAESGVTQQAIYFKDEATTHAAEAEIWKTKTVHAARWLGGFAFLSLLLSYVPALAPVNNLQAIQLMTSKVIIFGVLGYWLALSARNFMSHKHNQVVNRHRENALKTFKALSEGAANPDNKDIILTHASQCIFSPQETGYTHGNSSSDSGTSLKSVIEILPKALGKDSK